MTSLVSWIAVDQNSPSAFYMASDSRISWGSSLARWDAGRKLFLCRRHPDIFGYTGDVVFPSLVLGQITEAADAGLLFGPSDNSENRHEKLSAAINASFGRSHNTPTSDFRILHASRQNSGDQARFHLWCLSYNSRANAWSDDRIAVPSHQSALLVTMGTGAKSIKANAMRWEASDQAGTSRAIFGAFCDSIRSSADPLSGGVPQLVGMYHTRLPQPFGIVHDNHRYLHGFPLPSELEADAIEWRDELFQRIDGKTLKTVQGAQRHVRPK